MPGIRLRRWLLALMVLCLSSVGGVYGAGHEVSATSQPRVAAGLLRLAGLPPVAAAVSSCPPDPCVPGNAVGRDFFMEVMGRLSDVPPNEFAVDALVAWEPWENTLACWNPLATTQPMSVICDYNSAGVQSYQDQAMGVQATAITLNLSYYNAIRSMLRLEVFDRAALRAALDKWGTCAGIYCDPLLNTWQDLWDAYVGVCCGCLPASCCSAADIAQTSHSATTTGWTDPGALSSATLSPSAASSICQTAGALVPIPIEEEVESRVPDEPDLLEAALPYMTDAPDLEPIDVLPEEPDPVDSQAPGPSPAQWKAVEPQRIPPASANYSILKSVFGSGGGNKTSTSYVMNSTQGQFTDLSRRTSASYVLLPGYWGASIPHIFEYRVYLPVILRED